MSDVEKPRFRRFWASSLSAAAAGSMLCCGGPSQSVVRAEPADESYGMTEPEPQDEPAAAVAPPEEGPSEPPVAAATGQFDVKGSVERDWRNRQKSTPAVRTVELGATLTKKWTAKVGKTTFRTTMGLVGDAVVIGTHGKSLGGKNERDDGVYLLEAATGKRRRFIATPGGGDRDVGGIAVDGDRVYFTTDNSQVVAATLEGKILWKAKGKGKVRPAPALADLDGDGQLDVVVGDEAGVLRAFNGKNGKRLWSAATGVNDYDAKGFLGAAAIADLDGDGRDDVIAGARGGVLTAYEGKSGKAIWQASNSSGIHASPSIGDFDHDGKPEVLAAWSYGNVAVYDGKLGNLLWGTVLRQDDGGIEGLFGSPIPLDGNPGVILQGTSWWGKEDGVIGLGVDQRMFKAFEGRVSSSAVVTDLDGDGAREGILGTEKGKVIALHADGGHTVLASLGGAIEAPAMLADVDKNGSYELLVASNDGKLTCFETGSRTKPSLSRFRGESLHNRGDLGKVSLGWVSERGQGIDRPGQPGAIAIDYLNCCTALQDAARRAPSPQNQGLLRAAATCATLASKGTPRVEALQQIRQAVPLKTAMPNACQ